MDEAGKAGKAREHVKHRARRTQHVMQEGTQISRHVRHESAQGTRQMRHESTQGTWRVRHKNTQGARHVRLRPRRARGTQHGGHVGTLFFLTHLQCLGFISERCPHIFLFVFINERCMFSLNVALFKGTCF